MSFTLGIETSGVVGSVGLRRAGADLGEERFEEGMIHGVALAPAVVGILLSAGIRASDLDLIAVGLGPGSYTGVRVGVAFAKTLSFAAGVPVVGVPSFDAMAQNAPSERLVACARNARRGALYLGVYEADRTRRGDLALIPLRAARDFVPPEALVIGDATVSHPEFLSGDGREFGEPTAGEAAALRIAELGEAQVGAGESEDVSALTPIYLRMSEAEERIREKTDG